MIVETAVNQTLALVLWAKDQDRADDVAVFPGMLTKRDGTYFLDRDTGPSPEIRPEWLERIPPVADEHRETLCNCEFSLSLTVGEADDAHANFECFGLRWPS